MALSRAGLGPVAGVDEAGRGACAGPVTVAACVFPDRVLPELSRLTDSKKLSPRTREELFPLIQRAALAWAIVHIPPAEIDDRGIQACNLAGMRRALARLELRPGYVLTDAYHVPGVPQPQLPMVHGDATTRCVAGASVLAKVSRDRLMAGYDARWPAYGFAGHKGYGTQTHMAAVRRHGGSPIHRYTYANVAAAHGAWLAAAGPRSDGLKVERTSARDER